MAIVFVIALALGAWLARNGPWVAHEPRVLHPSLAMLQGLENAHPWIQHPLDADSLRGRLRVVLLWSDSDPRALRVLPDAEAWHRAYGRFGVRVVAVHVPQFVFAADSTVPARIARSLGLTLPIVSDPSYRVTGELGRMLDGPEIVIADRTGRLLLRASGAGLTAVDRVIRDAIDRGPEPPLLAAPEAPEAGSPVRTVHLGTSRVEGGPIVGSEPGRTRLFTATFRFEEEGEPYVPYPVGRWVPNADALVAEREGADVYLSIRGAGARIWAVIEPPPNVSTRVWVLADGQWLTSVRAGADVRVDARGTSYLDVTEPRLYEIARCPEGCVIKLSPGAGGLAFHAFAFEGAAGR